MLSIQKRPLQRRLLLLLLLLLLRRLPLLRRLKQLQIRRGSNPTQLQNRALFAVLRADAPCVACCANAPFFETASSYLPQAVEHLRAATRRVAFIATSSRFLSHQRTFGFCWDRALICNAWTGVEACVVMVTKASCEPNRTEPNERVQFSAFCLSLRFDRNLAPGNASNAITATVTRQRLNS